MPESAVRAERFDSSNTPSPSYVWEVSGKPVAVHMGLDLVDRLEHEVVENFRSLNSRGSEIGGILLGSVQNGSPLRVLIENYELIACDYSRGPLYRFSEADVERFDRAVQQRSAANNPRVVGFFRSHTRKGLGLDAEDAVFFKGHFRDPHQLALLIRPYASKPSTAGIFIWENGNLRSEASYLEFSFRRSVLEREPGNETAATSDEMTAGPVPTPEPAPAVTKPTTRAQIVPIASRREISLPTASTERLSPPMQLPSVGEPPVPSPEKTVPVQKAATIAEKAPPTQKTPAPEKPLPTQKTPVPEKPLATQKTPVPEKPPVTPKTTATEKTVAAQKPAAPEKLVAAVKPPDPPLPAPTAKDAVEEDDADLESPVASWARGKLMYVAGSAAVALLMLSGVLVYPGLGHKGKRASGITGRDASGLSLHVERSAGELLLTWNRDAEAIKSATRGELAIADGDQRENVNVDLPQLRNGSIVYAPSSADIAFQLSVIEKDSSKVQSESVRVLRTRPSPMPDGTPTSDKNPLAAIRPATNSATITATDIPNVETAQNTEPKPVTPAPASAPAPLKPFSTEAISQRLRPTRPSDLPDAPGLGGNEQFAVVLPGAGLGQAVPPPPSPAVSKPTPKQGGVVQQAELVSRVNPEYPMTARQSHVQGPVIVSAMVGTDGRIKSAKALSGHPLLQAAAVAAVKQWSYKPALLNGSPVESETRVELKFTLER